MSSIDLEMADAAQETGAPIEEQKTAGLPIESKATTKTHELADNSKEIMSAPASSSIEKYNPVGETIMGSSIEQEVVQSTDLEMSDIPSQTAAASAPIDKHKAVESQESAGQLIDKGKAPSGDHDMVHHIAAVPSSAVRSEEAPADVPQNATLSLGSGSSSDQTEESALQHLNVSGGRRSSEAIINNYLG
jgi:hypothetical protein